jgi:bacterioferritin-associated ferredoxin
MIVCVCKAVSDRQVRQAVREGAATFEDLQVDLGVSIKCGSCEDCVRHLLNEEIASEDSFVVASQHNECQPMFFLKRI